MFIFGATAGQSNPVVYTSDTFEVWTNQVSLVLDKIVNRPSEANHAFTAARTFFRWCEWLGNTVRGKIAAQLAPQPAGVVRKVLRFVLYDRVWLRN
jgi:hypothetical protein